MNARALHFDIFIARFSREIHEWFYRECVTYLCTTTSSVFFAFRILSFTIQCTSNWIYYYCYTILLHDSVWHIHSNLDSEYITNNSDIVPRNTAPNTIIFHSRMVFFKYLHYIMYVYCK